LNEQERAELEKTLREMNAEARARSVVEGYDEMSFEQRLAASAARNDNCDLGYIRRAEPPAMA
jgi:hypothetical protein